MIKTSKNMFICHQMEINKLLIILLRQKILKESQLYYRIKHLMIVMKMRELIIILLISVIIIIKRIKNIYIINSYRIIELIEVLKDKYKERLYF